MTDPIRTVNRFFFLPKQVPFPLIVILTLAVVISWIPLAVIAKSRATLDRPNPRYHLIQDLDHQAKLKAQTSSSLFTDGRSNRRPVAGTVAFGGEQLGGFDDAHRTLGFQVNDDFEPVLSGDGEIAENVWYTGLPAGLAEGSEEFSQLMSRGRTLYNTYCFTCHGRTGAGDGPTHVRASALQQRLDLTTTTVWAPPANLIKVDDAGQTFGAALYADGKLFDVIGHGKGNMAGYATQIHTDDRWAIVAYVRALQVAAENQTDANASDTAALAQDVAPLMSSR